MVEEQIETYLPLMNPYQYITQHPKRTIAILGITFEHFNELAQQAINQDLENQARHEEQTQRVNKKGAGSPKSLRPIEEICLTLFYLRQPCTFEVLGMHFGVSKTTANDRFHYWLKIIRDLLPSSLVEQTPDPSSFTALQRQLKEQELIVDSFEQERSRPLDNQEQADYFSGKKARHTFKNQVISLPEGGDIVDVVSGERGPEADINVMRKQLPTFDEEQPFLGDKAYVGEEQILTPKKKPRGGKLTSEQKEQNRVLSKRRIYIEHVIRRLRIFGILQGKFRLRSGCYQLVMLTVCGLTRLRMGTFKFA